MQNTVEPKEFQTWMLKIGHWEGLSYLILLGVAMPLKYIFNVPSAVSLVGAAHGVLFVGFCAIILLMVLKKSLTIFQALKAFLLSLVPFGTFFLKKVVL